MEKKERNGQVPRREKNNAGNKREFLPPLEFSAIVLPLFMQALLKLGLVEDPATMKVAEPNLELAKRLIDILDLLKDKTKGNLLPEEEEFLETRLSLLKMHYLRKTDHLKM
jgi:hypothetical protein